MSQAKVLHFNSSPLILWMRGSTPHIESQHLARLLGYVQPGSVRKQVLTDWKSQLLHDQDYVLSYDEDEIRAYEALEALHLGNCKPVKIARGRLFLTPSGVGRVLKKSSKTTKEFETFLGLKAFGGEDIRKAFNEARDVYSPSGIWDTIQEARDVFEDMAPPVTSSTPEQDVPSSSRGDSSGKYEVIQQLLHNLKEHPEPELRELAVEAAEMMLGRRLDDIRKKLLGQKKPSPPRKTEGPLFEEEDWYGCKQIGEMAGGYSSTTAGKAATIVGERWGYSATDIRKKALSFNRLVEAPDTNGKLRPQFRFNRAFSNEVILELRGNSHLTPVPTVPAQLVLSASRKYPKLTQGPFDEEEEQVSEHMESFLEVLFQNKH